MQVVAGDFMGITLKVTAKGGNFADGVKAFDGRRLGGEVFVSFDRRAVALIQRSGGEVLSLPATPR